MTYLVHVVCRVSYVRYMLVQHGRLPLALRHTSYLRYHMYGSYVRHTGPSKTDGYDLSDAFRSPSASESPRTTAVIQHDVFLNSSSYRCVKLPGVIPRYVAVTPDTASRCITPLTLVVAVLQVWLLQAGAGLPRWQRAVPRARLPPAAHRGRR